MDLNHKSPVPLWVALCVGVVVIGGVYVAAETLVAPQVTAPTLQSVSVQLTSVPASGSVAKPLTTTSSTESQGLAVSPIVDTNTWQTYRNTRYGYHFMYPPRWAVSAHAEGAARLATSIDSDITLTPRIGDLGLSVTVRGLGPDLITDYSKHPVTNLDEYLQFITAQVATSVLAFSNEEIVAGHRAMRYITCWGSGNFHTCAPRVYLQDANNIYILTDGDPEGELPPNLFDTILSSFSFGP